VGALGFWGGIMLYEYFNNDTKDFKTFAERTVDNIKATEKANANKTFKGMYSYMADANNFRICNSDKNYPVAMQGNYLELEKGYLENSEAGKEVYVELIGHLKAVKAMEGDGKEAAILVQELIKIDSKKVCK
jgi:uncharacterized lipoprotein NlpE involved in copper resistance